MNINIKEVTSDHPDFLFLKEKMEDYLDAAYANTDGVRRKTYRQNDKSLELSSAYIAYDGEKPVGICGFRMKEETIAELKKVYVLPEYSRGGIASSLISLVEEIARLAGAKRMVLKTGEPLRKAVDLYLRLNYSFIDKYSPYDQDDTAICRGKHLVQNIMWSDEKRSAVREGLGYFNMYRGKTFVIKYDGDALLHDEARTSVMHDIKLFVQSGIHIILVHGGKNEIDQALIERGITPERIEGQLVTTPRILEIIKEILLKKIGPQIVSQLDGMGISISGLNKNFISCKRKKINGETLGLMGEVGAVDLMLIKSLLDNGLIPVVSPIGVDNNGDSCNITSEEVAAAIAKEIKAEKLIFLSTVDGIVNTNGELISEMGVEDVCKLDYRETQEVCTNLKLKASVDALNHGITSVHIINGTKANALFDEIASHRGVGTMFVKSGITQSRQKMIDA
jgi:acetylglutamate kinase